MERRNSTQLESVESIREALCRRTLIEPEGQAPRRSLTAPEVLRPNAGEPLKFRPTIRQSMAIITVLYDGLDEGDRNVVQNESCVVGRSDADINIPHDPLLSSQHFKLYLPDKSGTRWRICDLKSTNGTFARIADALLVDEMEFLVGNHRYRFLDVDNTVASKVEPAPVRNTTQAWQLPGNDDLEARMPAVVNVTPTGTGERLPITGNEVYVGTDTRQCGIAVEDDQFVNSLHARIYRDEHGRWHLANNKSLNGTWVRINEIPIEKNAQIQAGEQRFSVTVP